MFCLLRLRHCNKVKNMTENSEINKLWLSVDAKAQDCPFFYKFHSLQTINTKLLTTLEVFEERVFTVVRL